MILSTIIDLKNSSNHRMNLNKLTDANETNNRMFIRRVIRRFRRYNEKLIFSGPRRIAFVTHSSYQLAR